MRATVVAILTLFLAVPAGAQQHGQHHGERGQGEHQRGQHHQGQHGAMMGGGMGGGMGMGHAMAMHAGPGPMMLVHHAEELGLDEEQVARMEALREETHSAVQHHQEQAQAARERAMALLTGETPDLEGFSKELRAAADHTVQAQVTMTRAHLEARSALSSEQRAQAAELMESMRGMRQGEGHHGEHGQRERHRGGMGSGSDG